MSRAAALALAALAVVATACVDTTDPEWQLAHERIVAVRAEPPGLAAGSAAQLDALVAHVAGPVTLETPMAAALVRPPAGLQGALVQTGGTWQIIAPDDSALATARAALGYAEGAPVPLDVLLQVPDSHGQALDATKTVWLGGAHANPAGVGTVTVGGAPPGDTIVLPRGVDVPLAVDPGDPASTVMWLTSCGTMHDDDERAAFVHVGSGDRTSGQLVLVVRDAQGGVAWQIWPARAQ